MKEYKMTIPGAEYAGRILHGAIIIIVVLAYTMYMFTGLNKSLTSHFNVLLNKELDKNPMIKKDYINVVQEIRQEKERMEQLEIFEAQARHIQEKISDISKISGNFESKAGTIQELTRELSQILEQSKKLQKLDREIHKEKKIKEPLNSSKPPLEGQKFVKFENEL